MLVFGGFVDLAKITWKRGFGILVFAWNNMIFLFFKSKKGEWWDFGASGLSWVNG